jgi:hypothetical protein
VESYHIASNKWVTRQNLTLARGDMAVGHIHNHGFAIAGETKDSTCAGANPGNSIPVSDVERLDQAGSTLGSWIVEENVPANRFRFIGASYGDEIFLFGGQGPLNATSREHPVLKTTMLYVPRSVADGRDEAAKVAAIVIVGALAAGIIVTGLIAYHCWARCQGYTSAPDASEAAKEEGNDKADIKVDIGDSCPN